jgi:hypothetical protein
MRFETVESVSVVNQIKCDRCGKVTDRDNDALDFHAMTSIGFHAGYASIFGDGNRIEIDLCEPCLKDTLGEWLRVRPPSEPSLPTMLAAFNPKLLGGEFPPRNPKTPIG